MKKSIKTIMTMAAAPAALMMAPSSANAQDILGQLGDHVENVFQDTLRDARREAQQQRREQAQERADRRAEQRRMRDRQRMERNALPNSDCRQSSTSSSTGRYYNGNETLRCEREFRTGPNGQQYNNGPDGRYDYRRGDNGRQPYYQQPYRQDQYRDNRQPISQQQWNYVISRCVTELNREHPRAAFNQLQHSCEQGFSRHYRVTNVTYRR